MSLALGAVATEDFMPGGTRPWLLACVILGAASAPWGAVCAREDAAPDLRRRVLEASGADLDRLLEQVAKAQDPDPWEVADDLCARGRLPDALRLAELLAEDGASLAECVKRGPAAEVRAPLDSKLEQAEQALGADDPAGALRALDANGDGLGAPTILAVRLLTARAVARSSLLQPREAAEADHRAGEMAWTLGWYRRAESAFQEALVSAYGAYDFERALRCAEGLLDCRRRAGQRLEVAMTLYDAGVIALHLGHLPEALTYAEESSGLFEDLSESLEAATSHSLASQVQAEQGDLRAAMELQGEAEAVLRDRPDTDPAVLENLERLGTIHRLRGDVRAGVEVLERAVAGRERTRLALAGAQAAVSDIQEAEAARARAEVDLATLLAQGERFDEALRIQERALATFATLEDALGIAMVQHNTADTLMRRARADLARAAEGPEEVQARARMLARGACERALGLLRQAQDAYRRMGMEGSEVTARQTVGEVEVVLENAAAAEQAFAASQRDADRLHMRRVAAGLAVGRAQASSLLERWAEALAHVRDGIQRMRELHAGLVDADLARARAHCADEFDIGIRAAVRLGSLPDTWAVLEESKAAALLRGMGSRAAAARASADPDAVEAWEQARGTKVAAFVAYCAAREGKQGKDRIEQAWQEYLKGRQQEERALEALSRAELSALERLAPTRLQTVAEVRRRMAELSPAAPGAASRRTVFVSFNLQPSDGYAFVVEAESERLVTYDATAVRAIRRALGRIGSPEANEKPTAPGEPGRPAALDEETLGPLREHLIRPLALPKGPLRVLLSPDRGLAFVPFALLLPEGSEIALEPSATTFAQLVPTRRLKGKGVLGLGNPDYRLSVDPTVLSRRGGARLLPLAHSKEEIEALTATAADVRLLGAEANEGALRAALTAKGANAWWRSIIFSAHGLVDVEWPSLSCLALTPNADEDGFLTAIEVLRLRFQTDLVVLSACQTGRGTFLRGEGIMGLARAFMHAGAPRVLVSLWNVDDAATAFLMKRFHARWGAGESVAAALVGAQRDTREHEEEIVVREEGKPARTEKSRVWEAPYYWAAWVLWGLPE